MCPILSIYKHLLFIKAVKYRVGNGEHYTDEVRIVVQTRPRQGLIAHSSRMSDLKKKRGSEFFGYLTKASSGDGKQW